MVNDEKKELLKITPYSKLRVNWSDRPENYSKEAKNRIKNHFSNKYGVSKNNINVIYKPVKLNDKGDLIEITGANVENIMDLSYQRSLMKEYIERDKRNVDFNRILALDDKINSELNLDFNKSQHKKWIIKSLTIDNFLSFGENVFLHFSKLNGLVIVNSLPQNQGGKTSLCIDAVKFLLYGNTTKTDKNEEIFNNFSDKNELMVRGMIDIDGDEIIIERKMKRSQKKDGGWSVINKVNFYRLLPDGTEEMQNEEDVKKTNLKLKETIGSEKDFETLVLATEKNLDDLIGLTSSESGKILTRLIGLEVLEQKESTVRIMYNEFSKKKKSNEYDVVTLRNDIETHNLKLKELNDIKFNLNKRFEEIKIEILDLNNSRDNYLNSKEKIDVVFSTLNPSNLQIEIDDLIKKGKSVKIKIEELTDTLNNNGDIVFNEDLYHILTVNIRKITSEKAVVESNINRINKIIDDLISGGICQTCKRKLDDVDNSEHILRHKNDLKNYNDKLSSINDEITSLNSEISKLDEDKNKVDLRNKLELDKDRLLVELGILRNDVSSKMNDLKKYNFNLEAIEFNKKVDIQITKIKTDLNVLEHTKNDIITKIERISNEINNNNNEIINKTKLIEIIQKEEEIEKIFKIYIELVGKKGISKLILRSLLPIINAEVYRLLEDVCDFEIEIFIDDKNDVQFLMNKDSTSKQLKSGSGFEKTAASLALRAVLGKLSTLPMPNFITFDEVLGKVALENIEKLKNLFDKIKDMYDIVFLITHNDLVRDWSSQIITVLKENNKSKILLN